MVGVTQCTEPERCASAESESGPGATSTLIASPSRFGDSTLDEDDVMMSGMPHRTPPPQTAAYGTGGRLQTPKSALQYGFAGASSSPEGSSMFGTPSNAPRNTVGPMEKSEPVLAQGTPTRVMREPRPQRGILAVISDYMAGAV